MRVLMFALMALLLLTGCPSEHSYLASKSPMFVRGYRDGCESAERYWKNNLVQYRVIDKKLCDRPDYKEGWDDGYQRCYAHKEMEIQMRRGAAF